MLLLKWMWFGFMNRIEVQVFNFTRGPVHWKRFWNFYSMQDTKIALSISTCVLEVFEQVRLVISRYSVISCCVFITERLTLLICRFKKKYNFFTIFWITISVSWYVSQQNRVLLQYCNAMFCNYITCIQCNRYLENQRKLQFFNCKILIHSFSFFTNKMHDV